jgi:RNA polymerase sigma factor for flagellar operon FliA
MNSPTSHLADQIAPLPQSQLPGARIPLDDAERERLLLEHLPQVHFVARRIHLRLPQQVLLEDLVHAGILGMIDAVRKYDPAKNVQLKHYAEFRIRGAILDSLRLVDWSPRALRRQARRMEEAAARCQARLGRDPSEMELADEMQVSLASLQRLQRDLRGLEVSSLQAETDDVGERDSFESIADSEEENPYDQTLRAERKELLERAIGELPPREREVLTLYDFQELTMKQVGERMRIGESRVSQIHTSALSRLRVRLAKMRPNAVMQASRAAREFAPGASA